MVPQCKSFIMHASALAWIRVFYILQIFGFFQTHAISKDIRSSHWIFTLIISSQPPPIIILFCWSSWNTFWHGVPTMQTTYEFMPLKGSPPHHFKGGKPWPTNCFRLKTPFGASFFIQMSKYVRFQSSVYLDPSIAYQMGFSIEFCIPLTILSFGVFQIVY